MKNIIVGLGMVLSLFLWSPQVGFCSETYTVTAEQMETLQTDLATLQQNNATLENLLEKSNQDLEIALTQLDNSDSQIETLNQSLTESQKLILLLKQELQTSNNRIVTLTNQLNLLSQKTTQAQNSLEAANKSLAEASASFKTYEAQQEKIENKLRTQKTLWQIIAGVAVGYAATK